MRKLFTIAILLSVMYCPVFAQQAEMKGKPDKPVPEPISETIRESVHRVTIAGETIEYKAIAGILHLKKEIDKPVAAVFFIAYLRADTRDASERPITFSFNGGPGSSSVWLHLGVLGPRRVLMQADGHAFPPPYELVNNDYSLLDHTDLVFIDPVSTGYSRAVPGEDPKQFHGVREDIRSVGEFIRLFLTRYERWNSPKFLIGESYGTLRAAGLADFLQSEHGMYLNGVMLVSSILDFVTARFHQGNDLPYILFLPTYTATAYYHGQLGDDFENLQDALNSAEEFALADYADALLRGDLLTEREYNQVASRLSQLTGLPAEYIRQSNLRVPIWRFVKELLREEGRTVGRLDSRFQGIDRDRVAEGYDYDPSYAEIQGPYSTLLNDYVRTELMFESDLPYEILTGNVHPWNFSDFENRYVSTSDRLRQAMTVNPNLKVFVANGYYDLATPYFATEYTFNHLQLDDELKDNVSMSYYEAGHMMYIRLESLKKLKADLADFIENSLSK